MFPWPGYESAFWLGVFVVVMLGSSWRDGRPRQVPHDTLDERLGMLDALRDREVIGPDEYAARRQRILDDAAGRPR